MRRAGRFLFADWPRTGLLAGGDGAWLRDRRGNRHSRRVTHDAAGRCWQVEDGVEGPFRKLVLRWRLPAEPGWLPTADGAAGPSARIAMAADAALSVAVESGWYSPAYGVVQPAAVLTARCDAPVSRLLTRITLAEDARP